MDIRLAKKELLILSRAIVLISEVYGSWAIYDATLPFENINRIGPKICDRINDSLRTVDDSTVTTIVDRQREGPWVNRLSLALLYKLVGFLQGLLRK